MIRKYMPEGLHYSKVDEKFLLATGGNYRISDFYNLERGANEEIKEYFKQF